jgi:GNAT superfamily N-acetyltransferase
VVVRRIVGKRGNRPVFTDALGELTALTADELTMNTAAGPLTVPLAAVTAAKRIPPRAVPRRHIRALEQAADEAWPAPVRQRLGDWLLRAADGWTGRGNSALPIGDPGVPLPAAIDAVVRWYGERGLPPRCNVPLPLAAAVDAALDARGWGRGPTVLVQTAPLASVLSAAEAPGQDSAVAEAPRQDSAMAEAPRQDSAAAGSRPDLPEVRLTERPSAAWLAMAAGRKGTPPPAALHLLTAVPHVRFAEVYSGDGAAASRSSDLLAVARGSVTGGGRWFGIMQLDVAQAARRRGLGRHVVAALTRWAAGVGATDAFLQVEEDNTAAVALYAGLGFTTHHTYVPRQL